MSDFPAPLTPADCDLRHLPYMPLHGDRLFTSETWLRANADAKVAALRLWWRSWREVPAASLPDDDMLLSEYAGYGVAIQAFRKIKAQAMRGWKKATDGRLYHPVVADIALKSYAAKLKEEEKKARDRQRKNKDDPPEGDDHSDGIVRNSDGRDDGIPSENALKGKVRKDNTLSEPNGSSRVEGPPAVADLAFEAYRDAAKTCPSWVQHRELPRSLLKPLIARMAEIGGISAWRSVLVRCLGSPFLRGELPPGSNRSAPFRLSLDFLTHPDSIRKILDGNYDDTPGNHQQRRANGADPGSRTAGQRQRDVQLAAALASLDDGSGRAALRDADLGDGGDDPGGPRIPPGAAH